MLIDPSSQSVLVQSCIPILNTLIHLQNLPHEPETHLHTEQSGITGSAPC
jgi:hypothetical protein